MPKKIFVLFFRLDSPERGRETNGRKELLPMNFGFPGLGVVEYAGKIMAHCGTIATREPRETEIKGCLSASRSSTSRMDWVVADERKDQHPLNKLSYPSGLNTFTRSTR
jgi:hypothetical protein